MNHQDTYKKETKTVFFQGKQIILESYTPVLSPQQRESRKREIEQELYEVFRKYKIGSPE